MSCIWDPGQGCTPQIHVTCSPLVMPQACPREQVDTTNRQLFIPQGCPVAEWQLYQTIWIPLAPSFMA